MPAHANKKYKGTSFIVLFLIMSVLLFFTVSNTVAADEDHFEQLTVRSGDSLWSIATEHHDENPRLSKQAFIRWVKDHNGLIQDRIVPDQRLIIPVKK